MQAQLTGGLARMVAPRTLDAAPDPDAPAFAVPARYNPRLQALVERINADEELWQWWRCANINALDRLGLNDHGEVHVRIVANAALRLLRLLREAGHTPGVVTHHHLTSDDAEVVVVLAAALHDLGMAVHPEMQLETLPALAAPKISELLGRLYSLRERTLMAAETLQVMAGHHRRRCLTLEASVLHLADALDIAEGRLHPAANQRGPVNGRRPPSPAAGVEAVIIKRGLGRPVRLDVRLGEALGEALGAGPVGGLLEEALSEAGLAGVVEVVAQVKGHTETPLRPTEISEP